MKPLYIKKNGTSQRVAAVEVKMPATYPASRVTYGDGTVEDALDSSAAIHTIGLGNNETLHIHLGAYTTNIMITAVVASGALLCLFSNGYIRNVSSISGISVNLDSQTYKDITIVNNSGNNTYVSVYARGDEDITITKS